MPHHKSVSADELQRKASIKDEATAPATGKMKKRPPSLNQINKNIDGEW